MQFRLYGSVYRKVWPALAAFIIAVFVGGLGIYIIENNSDIEDEWTFADSVYQSVITLTTVGLTEAHDLSQWGRMFVAALAIAGVVMFTYFGTSIAQYLISGELKGIWGRKIMEEKISQLTGHFIICGYGRIGRQVAAEFEREGHPILVIDKDSEKVQAAIDSGFYAITGHAGDDATLLKARVDHAQSLITVIDNDADNLMVSLSARGLNEKLFIIARAVDEMTESKLIAAGADRVLSPYGISGRRMAQMALRPNVVEFLEVVTHDQELELWLEELKVAFGSPLHEATLGGKSIREKTGANVVAIRQRTGQLIVSPPLDTMIQVGDIMIALGTRSQLLELRKMAFGTE